MKKTKLILIITGVFILFVLTYSFSYWLGQKSVEPKSEIKAPTFLTSKVTQKWNAVASGKITEISGRTLTLNKDGDILAVPIAETAKIYLLSSLEKEKKPESIQFEEIKVGDEVSISIKLSGEGVEGDVVTILP